MTDFSTWERATLEQLANDLMKDNLRLRRLRGRVMEALKNIMKEIT